MRAIQPLDLLVRGNLVLPDRVILDGALGIRGERIAAILGPGESAPALREVDFRHHTIVPGLVDTHVHTLSTSDEGITQATAAAAAGGVTTIVDMPYDAAGPINSPERLTDKIARVQAQALVDVGLYGTMAKRDGLGALRGLLDGGVLAFKFSLFETDPDRFPRILDGDLEAAFEILAESQVPIVLHAELQEIIERRLTMAADAGETDHGAHARSRPIVAETAAIAKALELAFWTGARVHVAHVTHPHGFRLVDWYRQQGAHVSAETCIQYLTLSAKDVDELGPLAKVNPPIRDLAACDGLWDALEAGLIATVSTDHAPWAMQAKQRPMLTASSGIPGLDTFLPALFTEARRRGVPMTSIVDVAARRPAEVFRVGDRKGALALGFDADFAVVDTDSPWRFDADHSFSSAKWSPFHGRTFDVRVVATYVRAKPVFEDGRIVQEPGYGRWLPPERSLGQDALPREHAGAAGH